jgi:hypothetical protein
MGQRLVDDKGAATPFMQRFLDYAAEAINNILLSIVNSVNGMTGHVVLTKDDIGLSNVDNTADIDKPVSDPMQEALDGKEDVGVAQTIMDEHVADVDPHPQYGLKPADFNYLLMSGQYYPGGFATGPLTVTAVDTIANPEAIYFYPAIIGREITLDGLFLRKTGTGEIAGYLGIYSDLNRRPYKKIIGGELYSAAMTDQGLFQAVIPGTSDPLPQIILQPGLYWFAGHIQKVSGTVNITTSSTARSLIAMGYLWPGSGSSFDTNDSFQLLATFQDLPLEIDPLDTLDFHDGMSNFLFFKVA